jgi:ABC-type polysaccharide/polyol phosphate transport system ATPase subunit
MKKNVPINTEEIAIELKNITKKYILHHEKPTLVEQIMKKGVNDTFIALDSINVLIHKGEKVGIIGSNGAGKTTLLKIISGITAPTRGTVVTNGRIISLIDLEAGFQPELTGEENIYLNGLLIGMHKNEIRQKFHDIIAFADIGEFIDSPLYTYSSGMKLRLGFSIAVHADPDILIIDEGITVGDQNFQKKASKKLDSLFKMGKTILLVSHWLDYLEREVDRIILIENHKIKEDGQAKKIIARYKLSK